jgi:predicted phosphate transport protein (TIGR00153 family)
MFKSKEVSFFDLFVESVQASHNAAQKLETLTNNYTNIKAQVKEIEEIEHQCDQHVHKILEQLNKSFITPIDREDIFLIAKEIDNITDAIESTAHRFIMLNVSEIRIEAKTLVSLIVQSTRELEAVMDGMRNMKSNNELKEKIIEVNRIEDEADDIFRAAITQLFASEPNAVEIIKWKEIFEYLENTIDACEDVANIVEGVVMKNS